MQPRSSSQKALDDVIAFEEVHGQEDFTSFDYEAFAYDWGGHHAVGPPSLVLCSARSLEPAAGLT